jgi:hypothetical protein
MSLTFMVRLQISEAGDPAMAYVQSAFAGSDQTYSNRGI